ncbi:hypothetical protein [Rhodomicrobium lacus]|uniref:hypothetical protein n=1 Tax=Rhodomicrobium lacus TaxID=2498452 RepID=UPI0013E0A98C|nr:hypothetical protein [Rhodomicrobium lacus]WKW51992.1 hypothetical protein QMO75_05800 [Rhodomicrobium lacus]
MAMATPQNSNGMDKTLSARITLEIFMANDFNRRQRAPDKLMQYPLDTLSV